MNYKIYTAGNKIIAVSYYHGKAIRGTAKCSPDDTYDYAKGEELATLRCKMKVAEKRVKRATLGLEEAAAAEAKAAKKVNAMTCYLCDARAELFKAQRQLEELEAEM